MLIQELWKSKLDWDEPVPENFKATWINVASDLEKATQIVFPRYYFSVNSTSEQFELHVFCDASPKAYGATAYLNNGTETTLVMAKSRVAPVKNLTLPQLELMAAVIGTRLASHVKSTFECKNVFFWSDSCIVLHWLKSSKPLKRFIANRVREITESTNQHEWRYCPTEYNPADLLTRGIDADQYINSVIWKKGPNWLTNQTKWPEITPTSKAVLTITGENDDEEFLNNDVHTDNYGIGSAEIKRLCESDIVKDTLSTHGVEWRFIPKRAPWYGGFWERLIALTKTSLKKVLGRSQVNMETLQTVVTEIETISNDRPLTYPSSDIKDCEALTPSHLLYGRRISTLPYPQSEIENILDPTYMGHKDLNKSVYRQTQLIQHFWKRWKSEYLTSLREFHRTIGKNEQLINTGHIVQIHNECPRINWKIGIVTELARGNDGLVRSARIRTSTGETTRPIAKLYPLEVTQTMTNNSNFPIGEQEHMEDRPKRKASLKARETIQKWIHQ
ncbi:uncharacterized protein [Mytilus edulis]|uniref:uncharacterized protein n=1 Tax=Mytilus edulis TaxID=6550 RepID=UPI0039EF4D55